MPRPVPPLALLLATTTLAATLAAAASAAAALPRPISQPLPFPYTGFDRFPAFYFGSRPEGLQGEGQLAVMARHSLVGWGWEQGLGPHCESCNGYKPTAPLDALHYCSSEQRLSESATRFRAYLQWGPPSRNVTTPPTDPAATKPIFVYRNFIIALHFYSIQRASYSRPELFLRDSKGNVCLHSRNGSPFWNFSSPDARRFFLEEMVTQAAMESGSNLVFFDGWDGSYMLSNDSSTYHGATAGSSCGSAVTFSVDYLKAEAEIMLQFLPQVAAVLNAKGKAPIFSSECSATVGYRCDCCRDRDRCCEQW